MEASLEVRGQRLDLSVGRAATEAERGGLIGREWLPWGEDGVRIPLPTPEIKIEIRC
jgi:hypothetical protein